MQRLEVVTVAPTGLKLLSDFLIVIFCDNHQTVRVTGFEDYLRGQSFQIRSYLQLFIAGNAHQYTEVIGHFQRFIGDLLCCERWEFFKVFRCAGAHGFSSSADASRNAIKTSAVTTALSAAA